MLVHYNLYSMTQYEAFIRLFYFVFTTMTTIGLGDYRPYGTWERLFTTFMLIFGVMLLTTVMGNLIDLLSNFYSYIGPIEDSEALCRFFNTLERFNDNEPIDPKIK